MGRHRDEGGLSADASMWNVLELALLTAFPSKIQVLLCGGFFLNAFENMHSSTPTACCTMFRLSV